MKRVMLVVMALAAFALGRAPGFDDARILQDSLRQVPPRLRSRWLNERGLELPGYNIPMPTSDRPDSLGLSLLGKWGRGPSWEVTGRDSLVFLSLGSEVAIINFANPDSPRVLSEVQTQGIVAQAAVRDSFLYIGCMSGWSGIEVWNIGDPESPVFRSRTPSLLSDFCIKDTFLYLTQDLSGQNDTFKVYGTSDPSSLHLLGTCRDSGSAVTVTGNTVLIAGNSAIFAIDVSNPASPHRVGSYPGFAIGLVARGNICCANIYWSTDDDHFRFEILDVSDPASMRRLGSIDSCGGYDVFLDGPLAFVSGYYLDGYGFQIVAISDSTNPAPVSTTTIDDYGFGVWENPTTERAYLACHLRGLTAFDVGNLNAPTRDTVMLAAGFAYDVKVQDSLMYVAGDGFGLSVVNVSSPTRPNQVGAVDSTRDLSCKAVAVRDSFAFVGWTPQPYFRSVDVTDPTGPSKAGGCNTFSYPMAMAVRDTFVYVAEANRFQVLNVARPRQPVLVGTCNLSGDVGDMCIVDSLAYVTSLSFTTINVTRPDSPSVVNLWSARASGVDVVDTIAYMAYYGLKTASIANPTAPYVIDTVFINDFTQCVVVVDSLAYLGGRTLRIFNVADPTHIFQVGSWQPPDWVYKLRYAPPYVYAACWGAGVCILDTVTTGISEERPAAVTPVGVGLHGSIVLNELVLELPATNGKEVTLSTYDMTGRCVEACVLRVQGQQVRYSFARLPAGVYVLRARTSGRTQTFRVVKL